MGEFAIGQSVLRREDPRLLRGQGRFFDDFKLVDQLHSRDAARIFPFWTQEIMYWFR
jgi:hypothetical protein